MLPTSTVLRRTLEIIQARGWTYRYSSDSVGPLNIRSAVSRACTQLCDDQDWHAAYSGAIAAMQDHKKDGVMSWEFGTHASTPRRRAQDEVETILTEVINRLENHEAQAGQCAGGSHTNAGTAGERDTGAGPTAV